MKNMYDMEHRTTQDSNLVLQLQQQFLVCAAGNICSNAITLALSKDKNPINEIVMTLKNFLTEGRATMPNGTSFTVIEGRLQDKKVLVVLYVNDFKDVHKLTF